MLRHFLWTEAPTLTHHQFHARTATMSHLPKAPGSQDVIEAVVMWDTLEKSLSLLIQGYEGRRSPCAESTASYEKQTTPPRELGCSPHPGKEASSTPYKDTSKPPLWGTEDCGRKSNVTSDVTWRIPEHQNMR